MKTLLPQKQYKRLLCTGISYALLAPSGIVDLRLVPVAAAEPGTLLAGSAAALKTGVRPCLLALESKPCLVAKGTITAVSRRSITVQSPDGSAMTFDISRSTQVTLDGKVCNPHQLREGQAAEVASIDGVSAATIAARTHADAPAKIDDPRIT
jgi:hypothetical protein